jgi:hypothetical protein
LGFTDYIENLLENFTNWSFKDYLEELLSIKNLPF